MINFADRLASAIDDKNCPCVVGLDPRLEMIPEFVKREFPNSSLEAAGSIVNSFNMIIISAVANIVPAVKLQIAFYEQYGIPGLRAFKETIDVAKEHDLIVIVDAKRNDVASTAQAYANAFLGRTQVNGDSFPVFDADCLTISPFLGRDSIMPFVDTCARFGKGLFILVKTSNPGSVDIQDQLLRAGNRLYERLAKLVDDVGSDLVGNSGFSAVGAVVGATYPHEATWLRNQMPRAFILVPGYGTQGGTARDVLPNFRSDRRGALISASRSVTYPHRTSDVGREEYIHDVHSAAIAMRDDINATLSQMPIGG